LDEGAANFDAAAVELRLVVGTSFHPDGGGAETDLDGAENFESLSSTQKRPPDPQPVQSPARSATIEIRSQGGMKASRIPLPTRKGSASRCVADAAAITHSPDFRKAD
jgi:hypothetical protein